MINEGKREIDATAERFDFELSLKELSELTLERANLLEMIERGGGSHHSALDKKLAEIDERIVVLDAAVKAAGGESERAELERLESDRANLKREEDVLRVTPVDSQRIYFREELEHMSEDDEEKHELPELPIKSDGGHINYDAYARTLLDRFYGLSSNDDVFARDFYKYQKSFLKLLMVSDDKNLSPKLMQDIIGTILFGFEQDYGIHKDTIWLLKKFFIQLPPARFEYFFAKIILTHYKHNSNQIRQGLVRVIEHIGHLDPKISLNLLLEVLFEDRDLKDTVRFLENIIPTVIGKTPQNKNFVIKKILDHILQNSLETPRFDHAVNIFIKLNGIELLFGYPSEQIAFFIDQIGLHIVQPKIRPSYVAQRLFKKLLKFEQLQSYYKRIQDYLEKIPPAQFHLETLTEANIRFKKEEKQVEEFFAGVSAADLDEERITQFLLEDQIDVVYVVLTIQLDSLWEKLPISDVISRYSTYPRLHNEISEILSGRLFWRSEEVQPFLESLIETLIQVVLNSPSQTSRGSSQLLREILKKLKDLDRFVAIKKIINQCILLIESNKNSHFTVRRSQFEFFRNIFYAFEDTMPILESTFYMLGMLEIKDDWVCSNANSLLMNFYARLIKSPSQLDANWVNLIKDFIVKNKQSNEPAFIVFLNNNLLFCHSILLRNRHLSAQQLSDILGLLISTLDCLNCSYYYHEAIVLLQRLEITVAEDKKEYIASRKSLLKQKLDEHAFHTSYISKEISIQAVKKIEAFEPNGNQRMWLDKILWLAQFYIDLNQPFNVHQIIDFEKLEYDYIGLSQLEFLKAKAYLAAGWLDEALQILQGEVDIQFAAEIFMLRAQIYYQKRANHLAIKEQNSFFEWYSEDFNPFTQHQINIWIKRSTEFSVSSYVPKKQELDELFQKLKVQPVINMLAEIDKILVQLKSIFGSEAVEKAKGEYPWSQEYLTTLIEYEHEARSYINQFVEFLIRINIQGYYHGQYALFQQKDQASLQDNILEHIANAKLIAIYDQVIGDAKVDDKQVDPEKSLLSKLNDASCKVFTVFEFIKQYALSDELVDAFTLGISEDMASTYDVFLELFKLQGWEATYGLYNIYDLYDKVHTPQLLNTVAAQNKSIVFFIPINVGSDEQIANDGVTYNEVRWVLEQLESAPHKLRNFILVFDAYNYLPYYLLKKEKKNGDSAELKVEPSDLEATKCFIRNDLLSPTDASKFTITQAKISKQYPYFHNLLGEIQYKFIKSVRYDSFKGLTQSELQRKQAYLEYAHNIFEKCRNEQTAKYLINLIPEVDDQDYFERMKYCLCWLDKCMEEENFSKIIFSNMEGEWREKLSGHQKIELFFDRMLQQVEQESLTDSIRNEFKYVLPALKKIINHFKINVAFEKKEIANTLSLLTESEGGELFFDEENAALLVNHPVITQNPSFLKKVLIFIKEKSIELKLEGTIEILRCHFVLYRDKKNDSEECICLLIELCQEKLSITDLYEVLNFSFKEGFNKEGIAKGLTERLQKNQTPQEIAQVIVRFIPHPSYNAALFQSIALIFPIYPNNEWRHFIVKNIFELLLAKKFGTYVAKRNIYILPTEHKKLLKIIAESLTREEKLATLIWLAEYQQKHPLEHTLFCEQLDLYPALEEAEKEENKNSNQHSPSSRVREAVDSSGSSNLSPTTSSSSSENKRYSKMLVGGAGVTVVAAGFWMAGRPRTATHLLAAGVTASAAATVLGLFAQPRQQGTQKNLQTESCASDTRMTPPSSSASS